MGKFVENHQNERLKNDTFLFIHSITFLHGKRDFTGMDDVIREFDYRLISEVPDDVATLFFNENANPRVTIFKNASYVGFLLEYPNRNFVAIKQINRMFWEEYFLQILLLPIALILIIFLVMFYATLNPIERLIQALKASRDGNFNFPISAKPKGEIGNLIQLFSEEQRTVSRILKTRELMLYGIGHELRTPLAKMKLLLGIKSHLDGNDKKLQKYIMDLQKICDNLLEFESIHSGNLTVNKKDFCCTDLLLEALSGFEEEESKISVDIKERFPIRSDLHLLSIVVKNLVENALKYSSDGKIAIGVQDFKIRVSNKGSPLEHEIEYYLKPFYRDVKYDQIDGYGLGLSIVSEIVEVLGIEFEYFYADGMHHFQLNFNKNMDGDKKKLNAGM
ncbi:HAMP domain-containing sensor histidine kinase [Helicobacter mustelae]|uniref:histidine kinase n=1 Tax=Helicobacter mustelae (strain ATCC 43772 / CCUG 25715 / CIP 103759 / LMG 18044 / NCTC 12198 / R85-136P) TaxID=679897 RepID=D3UGA1_HELM1|nr:ATP-binding protein [Helicobacter mustelae]CBG39522.1 putative two-component sensor Histidine kinase [Helicobacter mustelae 12198]SQH71033.1 two-component sensor Histidine kinase [Helicobacter mustelae]STP12162.1 two-component sensor Histidine kinase [Helicobacter mustelae]